MAINFFGKRYIGMISSYFPFIDQICINSYKITKKLVKQLQIRLRKLVVDLEMVENLSHPRMERNLDVIISEVRAFSSLIVVTEKFFIIHVKIHMSHLRLTLCKFREG